MHCAHAHTHNLIRPRGASSAVTVRQETAKDWRRSASMTMERLFPKRIVRIAGREPGQEATAVPALFPVSVVAEYMAD